MLQKSNSFFRFNFLFTKRKTKHYDNVGLVIKTLNLFTPVCEDAHMNHGLCWCLCCLSELYMVLINIKYFNKQL